jgi:hypothetical protein
VTSIGLYPRVQVDACGTGIVSRADGVALVETGRAADLDRALSTALAGGGGRRRDMIRAR